METSTATPTYFRANVTLHQDLLGNSFQTFQHKGLNFIRSTSGMSGGWRLLREHHSNEIFNSTLFTWQGLHPNDITITIDIEETIEQLNILKQADEDQDWETYQEIDDKLFNNQY